MIELGFPQEAINGIKDSVDCNLYFFESKVELGTMYLILGGAVLALVAVYVLINGLFGKKAR